MAFDNISATNLANYLPSIWSKEVLSFAANALVLGALVDRGYEGFATDGGSTIVVPNLAEITANAVNTALDLTWYDTIQNVTNISLNKKYDIGVMVSEIEQMQTNPKYFEKVRNAVAFGLAKQIDVNIAKVILTLTNSAAATGTYGIVNTALTEDVLMASYEALNKANAPFEDRVWVFDPASITDLLKLDYFTQATYVGDVPVTTGFVGRKIFGSPVYISTNLWPYAGGPHAAAYFQRQAIALVVQMPPKFEVAHFPARHGDGIIGLTAFGVQEMQQTFGVYINSRN